jgi:hypothetical protein
VIEKHGKPAALLVSIGDLERLERLDALELAAVSRPLAGSVKHYAEPFEPASEWDPEVVSQPTDSES